MAKNNDLMSIAGKEADNAMNGLPSDRCPICGHATGNIPVECKESTYERKYHEHYACGRNANTQNYVRFEKDFSRASKLQELAEEQQREAQKLAADKAAKKMAEEQAIPVTVEVPETVEVPVEPAPTESTEE